MSAKHTGGTWRAAAKPSSIVGWPIISAPQGKSVANVHGTDEESAANARLIAAAPRILEELQRLVNIADSGLFRDRAELSIATHPAYDDARELIKSIIGETK